MSNNRKTIRYLVPTNSGDISGDETDYDDHELDEIETDHEHSDEESDDSDDNNDIEMPTDIDNARECRERLLRDHPELKDMSIEDLVDKFVTEDFAEQAAAHTRTYAMLAGDEIAIDSGDIFQYFCVLQTMGFVRLPDEEQYWSTSMEIGGNPLIKSIITRDRFREIKRNFHFVDYRNLDRDNRLAKVQPLLDFVNDKIIQFVFLPRDIALTKP